MGALGSCCENVLVESMAAPVCDHRASDLIDDDDSVLGSRSDPSLNPKTRSARPKKLRLAIGP